MEDFNKAREQMVEKQLRNRGIRDSATLNAMRQVPREDFVPRRLRNFAYQDGALPIGDGQTISQPYIVALMTEALELSDRDRILEVGTGSGYSAAILSCIAAEVHTVERNVGLAGQADARLQKLGYDVHVHYADGSLGWPEDEPYNAIVVTAGSPDVPDDLLKQLTVNGRMVIPVGSTPREQILYRIRKVSEDKTEKENLGGVLFVPLVGEAGWDEG